MKKNQIIVIDSIDSPYFESAVLIVKENAVCEDDRLLNEANAIVNKFAGKCGLGYHLPKRRVLPTVSVAAGISAAFTIICIAVAMLT